MDKPYIREITLPGQLDHQVPTHPLSVVVGLAFWIIVSGKMLAYFMAHNATAHDYWSLLGVGIPVFAFLGLVIARLVNPLFTRSKR